MSVLLWVVETRHNDSGRGLARKQHSCHFRFSCATLAMATNTRNRAIETLVLALPETAGAALYGLVDVLTSAGLVWAKMMRSEPASLPFNVRIASMGTRSFRCGNGIPVSPSVASATTFRRHRHHSPAVARAGRTPGRATYRSRCVDSRALRCRRVRVFGLLRSAIAGRDRSARRPPGHVALGLSAIVRAPLPSNALSVRPEPVFRGSVGPSRYGGGRDGLARSRAAHHFAYVGTVEALQIAKVYLLKMHEEGQLPYRPMVRPQPHADETSARANAG